MPDKQSAMPAYGRRQILKLGTGLAATGGLALIGASPAQSATRERALSFYHLHTGEKLNLTYWENGNHIPEALVEINHILRDFRTAEVQPIDVRLLDLLHRVRQSLGTEEPYHIISGYRSPTTNAKLAKNSRNVARRSLHLSGKAIDVRIPSRPLRKVHKAAAAQKLGGVGFYPKSNFVHLDTGRVRYW
jgi:uncharacterized protein YcbK (DUF882 family)